LLCLPFGKILSHFHPSPNFTAYLAKFRLKVVPHYLSPHAKSKEEASILTVLMLFLNNIKMEFREREWNSGVRGTKLSGSGDEL
jgi:hypothetical protein